MPEDQSADPMVIDFYDGRGADAQYLGSVTGAPGLPYFGVFQSVDETEYTRERYRRFVEAYVSYRLWPHRHASSDETAWTFAYDKGSVYVYRYGVEMLVIRCNTHRTAHRNPSSREPAREWRPVNRFPAMIGATA